MSGTTTYFDARWRGTPTDIGNALATYGWTLNVDDTITLTDPTKNTIGIIGAAGGAIRVLDGVAYVSLRATSTIPTPTGITDPGEQHAAAIAGVWEQGPMNPTVITSAQFFDRFTQAEQAAIWAACIASPALGAGLIGGLSAGLVDLTSPTVKAWLDGFVTAGALTAGRETTILTP